MSTAQKISFQKSLNAIGQARAQDEIRALGRALPCSVVAVNGAIVAVKFEIESDFIIPNVTMPMVGSEYLRLPVQVGDKGVCFGCDASIGHISGLGAPKAPDLTQPGNLSALVFFPIGSKLWRSESPDKVTIYAPNGVIIKDFNNASSVTVLPGSVVILGNGMTTSSGVVTKDCVCAFTGAPHPMASTTVKASL